jgi:hypothetical protein
MYKLVNKTTKEETICTKVNVDGFDYYLGDKIPNNMDYYYAYVQFESKYKIGQRINPNKEGYSNCKKVIATNNPGIDIPQIIDEVEELAILTYPINGYVKIGIAKEKREIWKNGYNKHKETNTFSEEDMIEFSGWKNEYQRTEDWYNKTTTKELLKLWKEQKLETIYYQ